MLQILINAFSDACWRNDAVLVEKMFIQYSIHQLAPEIGNPFRQAAEHGYVDVCAAFLRHGVPVEGNGLYTPLMAAAMMNHTAVCLLLLEHGADVHLKRERDGIDSREIALDNDRTDIVHLFDVWAARQEALSVLLGTESTVVRRKC